MGRTSAITVIIAAISVLVLAGCAQLLPPGWNTTTSSSPTGAITTEMEETSEDITVLEEAEDTELAMDTPVEETDSALPRKTVVEGDLVSFPNLQAIDPDGDPITYTFTPPLSPEGKWQTKVGDAGEYRATITASDGKNSVGQEVIIEVTPKNRAPKIMLASKEITIKEGDTVTLQPEVSDADGDKVMLTFEGWMTAASKTTTFSDAGRHEVDLIASDGTTTTREKVIVTVENANRAPIINPINDVIVKEGDRITVSPTATDPDGDKVSFIYGSPVSEDGTWQTTTEDVGKYRVNVTATDGSMTATASFLLTVESLNKAPIIQVGDLVTIDEGKTVTLSPVITDPEGDELAITYSGWMNTNTYTTTYEDSGAHLVTITASDGINTAKKDITVLVNDVNRPPTFGSGAFN